MNDKVKQEEFLKYLLPNKERLSRFARAMCMNNEDAKDLVADTILSAFERFDKIKNKEAFLSYLFTTASRIYKRKHYRKKFFGIFDESQAENLISNDISADVKLDIEILYKMLEKLPPKQKEALVLFEISGLTLDEIRKIQGGSISGVKSRLKRGRDSLAELMRDDTKMKNSEMRFNGNGSAAKINTDVLAINLKVHNE